MACFFVGKDKDYTVKVLDSSPDTHAVVRVQNLMDRNLLTIDYHNKLRMHQLISDMGRNIVYQESLEPERRSRLWREVEAYGVLRNKKGTEITEGLTLDMHMLKEDEKIARKQRYEETLDKVSPLTGIRSFFQRFGLLGQQISSASRNQSLNLSTKAFEKMENLRLLKLNYTQVAGRYDNFPKKLTWLCWHGFSLKNMPTELSLENLVVLDLRHSQLEEVWAGPKFLGSLKILNLSYSERLAKTPNFSGVSKLERLILKGCVSLIEICESIESLEELDLLDLTDCKNLRKLPRNMHKLQSLETLIFSGCSTLFADGLDISATRNDNGQGKWWRTSLLLPWVLQPMKGPQILFLPSLKSLNLSNCNLSDGSLPCAFSNLWLLENLDLSKNLFRNLPDCIASLSCLRKLSLHACHYLDLALSLPSNLQKLNCRSCISLRKIAFQSAPHQLYGIETTSFPKMVEIEGILKREPIGNVDARITKNLGIDVESIKSLKAGHTGLGYIPVQGFYEFGIFSTFVPGGEIPSCFSERKKGSLMSFTVPSLPNFRIQCFNFCYVYASCRRFYTKFPGAIKIENRTKDLTWIYSPIYFGIPEYDKMSWFSQWNFGNQVEGGDELVVSVRLCDKFVVEECGLNIVYKEEEEEVYNNSKYFHWNEVVAGELSNFKLYIGAYFLDRRFYLKSEDFVEFEGKLQQNSKDVVVYGSPLVRPPKLRPYNL